MAATGTGGYPFDEFFGLCTRLATIATSDDTLRALSYGLWEWGIPGLDRPRPEVLDFLLSSLAFHSDPVIQNYAATMLAEYAEDWPAWNWSEYQKLLRARDAAVHELIRNEFDLAVQRLQPPREQD
jgi:hypothetical protein